MVDRRMRLRLGLFVAGTLAGLSGLVVLFGGAPNLFSSKIKYIVLFPEAPGITVGTPIRKSGVRIGEVTAIDLDPTTSQVRIGIAVDPKYLPRQNEEPTITRGLLSGDSAIDFLPKLGEENPPTTRGVDYPPGSEITGLPPITPRSLLTPASGVIATAQTSLDRIVHSFELLEKAAPKLEMAADEIAMLAKEARQFLPELKKTNDRIQRLIGSDGPRGDLKAISVQPDEPPDAANLRTLVREIQEMVKTARPAIDDIRGFIKKTEPDLTAAAKSARQTFDAATTTFGNVNELLSPENRMQISELVKNLNAIGTNILKFSASLTTLIDEAEKTVKSFDSRLGQVGDVLNDVRMFTRPFAAKSEDLVRNVTESTDQLGKAIAEVREIIRVFARDNGTLQKLMTDSSLYASLDSAACSLSRLMNRAEKIAKDLEVFADKVARRPELIGVGGVVKPSSGLKDAPSSTQPSYRPDWPPSATTPPNWLQPPVPNAPETVQGYPIRK